MKCVFIINPHAGEADNEEKIRREAAGIEGADCEFYVTKAVGRNLCEIGAKNMPAKRCGLSPAAATER